LNSPLAYIAGLLVVLLFLALIVPRLIDWNAYRGEIETQASDMAGREVKISGDMSFSIFPQPHLKVASMRIANIEGAQQAFFAQFDTVEAEVALLPLLRGELSVTKVHVVHPEFHFEVLADGRDNWRDFFARRPLPEEGMFSPGSIRLNAASFERGIVTYANAKSGRSWRLDNLKGDVVANSLLGPINADFEFDIGARPYAMRVAVGSFAEDKPFPLTTEISRRNVPARFLFTGTTTSFSSGAEVQGTGSFEYGSGENNAVGQAGRKLHAPIRIEAQMQAVDGLATFDDFTIGMSGTTLKGAAKADWRARPRVDITLAAQALTLDSVIDRMGEVKYEEGKPFARFLGVPLPRWFDLSADVKVDGLLAHEVLVRNARLIAALNDGALEIANLEGEIASNTNLKLSGVLRQGETGKRFDGKWDAQSRDIGALAQWLEVLRSDEGLKPGVKPGAKPAPTQAHGQPFAITSDLMLTPASAEFRNVRAAFAQKAAPAQATGFVRYLVEGGQSLVASRLEADFIDVGALVALLPPGSFNINQIIGQYDLDLMLNAKEMRFRDTDAKAVLISLSLIQNVLSLRDFEVGDLAGAKISLAGMLSGVEAGKLERLKGSVNGELAADTLNPLLVLLGASPRFDAGGQTKLSLSAASGEAMDSQNRLDVFTLQGMVGGSRVDAVVRRSHSADGRTTKAELIANAMNNDGKVLLRQFGFVPDEAVRGVASLALQMSGSGQTPYNVNLRFNANGGTLLGRGTMSNPWGARSFNGHIDVSAPALEPALAAVGLRETISAWLGTQAGGAGFVLSSDIAWGSGALQFSSTEAVAGSMHLTGNAVYAAPQGAPPAIKGELAINTLDVTPLIEATVPQKDGQSTEIWSSTPIDWTWFSDLKAEFGLKVQQMRLGPLRFDQAQGKVSITDGMLSISPMSARFANGVAAMEARFSQEQGGDGAAALSLRLEGVDLAAATQRAFGAAVGGGKSDLVLKMDSVGRSWFALVASAKGEGNFMLRRGSLIPFNLPAFGRGASELASLDGFAALQEATLTKGSTQLQDFGGAIIVEDGTARFALKDFALDGGRGSVEASFDLPRLEGKSDMALTPRALSNAPALHVLASVRQAKPERDLNTTALQAHLGKQLLAREAEKAGLSDVPAELRQLSGGDAAVGVPVPQQRPVAQP